MCEVSIIMPAFNAAAFIHEAIDSVLRQEFADWELLIVDDASTDGTLEQVRTSFPNEPRIRSFRLERNAGPSVARNHALRLARGRFVTVLDSDDKYLAGRLASLVHTCANNALDLAADNQLYYNATTRAIFQTAFMLPRPSTLLTAELLVRNDGPPLRFSFGALKPFIRRAFLERHGLTYPEALRIGEDFVFLFRVLNAGAKAWLLAEPSYVYTVPVVRAKAASDKTRTNYGEGNLEQLIRANRDLLSEVPASMQPLHRLLEGRQRRLQCALALRERGVLPRNAQLRRLWRESGWRRFAVDKVRNVFQRSHAVRGI